jgi:hypothetical protein
MVLPSKNSLCIQIDGLFCPKQAAKITDFRQL